MHPPQEEGFITLSVERLIQLKKENDTETLEELTTETVEKLKVLCKDAFENHPEEMLAAAQRLAGEQVNDA